MVFMRTIRHLHPQVWNISSLFMVAITMNGAQFFQALGVIVFGALSHIASLSSTTNDNLKHH